MKDNQTRASCGACYFRHAALCALELEAACPTFRHHERGPLVEMAALRVPLRQPDDARRERRLSRPAA